MSPRERKVYVWDPLMLYVALLVIFTAAYLSLVYLGVIT